MKTVRFTTLATSKDTNALETYKAALLAKSPKLPKDVLHSAIFDMAVQTLFLGNYDPDENTAYRFYTESMLEGREVDLDDPVGTIQIRMDYDPHHEQFDDDKHDMFREELFDTTVMVIAHPHDLERNPQDAGVDHIRVQVKVDEDTIITRTIYPVVYLSDYSNV